MPQLERVYWAGALITAYGTPIGAVSHKATFEPAYATWSFPSLFVSLLT